MNFIQEEMSARLNDLNREIVLDDYNGARKRNSEAFVLGDVKAGREYIYDNQREDAAAIVNIFYTTKTRVVSIVKRTKVGMDGLMIEIAKLMATHPDDSFMVHRTNVYLITGMSNISWETNMKEKAPLCFKTNIFHHGKLQKCNMNVDDIKNAIIIIDEIDSGDGEGQKLHNILERGKILDIENMERNNIRLVFVSATMLNELREMRKWGDNNHKVYRMTIPPEYIGHKDFLERGIIQPSYAIDSPEKASGWISDDILSYGEDFRVHIIRTNERNVGFIAAACNSHGVTFKNHTSLDRITDEEFARIFDTLSEHLVIAIKGLFRRANLIYDTWKVKIGATHELYVHSADASVQVQGLPGRMSGYWRAIIDGGHRTGPYRTDIEAIEQYERFYADPYKEHAYKTTSRPVFMNPKNVKNLITAAEPSALSESRRTNMRVPIIISLSSDASIFSTTTAIEKLAFIRTLLRTDPLHKKLYDFIMRPDVVRKQITKPRDCASPSYKKHILDCVGAANNNKPFSIDLKPDDKLTNNWQAFIDSYGYRLCIVLWTVANIDV